MRRFTTLIFLTALVALTVIYSQGATGTETEWTQTSEADWNAGTHNQTETVEGDVKLNTTSLSGKAYDDHQKVESGGIYEQSDTYVTEKAYSENWAGRTVGYAGRVYFNFDIIGITNVNSASMNICQSLLQGNPSPLQEIDVFSQLTSDISEGRNRSQYRIRSAAEGHQDEHNHTCRWDGRGCGANRASRGPRKSGPY